MVWLSQRVRGWRRLLAVLVCLQISSRLNRYARNVLLEISALQIVRVNDDAEHTHTTLSNNTAAERCRGLLVCVVSCELEAGSTGRAQALVVFAGGCWGHCR